MKLGDMIIEKVDSISTGSIIDAAQVLEAFLKEELLKYLVQNHLVKLHYMLSQNAKRVEVLQLLLMNTLDRIYAENLGVDIDNLVIFNLIMRTSSRNSR